MNVRYPMSHNTITSISIIIIVILIVLLLVAIICNTITKTQKTDHFDNINPETSMPIDHGYETGYNAKFPSLSERCINKFKIDSLGMENLIKMKNIKTWNTTEDFEIDSNLNKFNGDYIDTISVVNNLIQFNPLQNYKFNNGDSVVTYDTNVSKLETRMILYLMIQIAKMINTNDKKMPFRRDNTTDWNEPLQEPNVMSGWEKQLNNIGVEIALYDKFNDTRHVSLKHVFKIVKNETQNEIQHIVTIGIQKRGSEHIMILKIYLLTTKQCANKNAFVLENVDIVGFISETDLKNRIANGKIENDMSTNAFDNLKKDDINWNVDELKLKHDITLGNEISTIIDHIDKPRVFTKEMILQNDSLWLPSANSAIAFSQ
jgi:hypothetical protein